MLKLICAHGGDCSGGDCPSTIGVN